MDFGRPHSSFSGSQGYDETPGVSPPRGPSPDAMGVSPPAGPSPAVSPPMGPGPGVSPPMGPGPGVSPPMGPGPMESSPLVRNDDPNMMDLFPQVIIF